MRELGARLETNQHSEVSIPGGKVLDSRVPWAAAGTLASPETTLDDYLLPCHTASAPLGQTQGLCHLSGWGMAETPSTRGTACKGQHPLTYPQTPP